MSDKDDIQKIKDTLQATGAMIVKEDIWPPASSRLLVVGSRSSSMDSAALANDLYELLGITATPMPKKVGLSNLYSFVVYTPTATAPLYDEVVGAVVDVPITCDLIEGCFGGDEFLVDYQVSFVGLGVLESPVSPSEMADLIMAAGFWGGSTPSDEVPIPFANTDILPPNTWVVLRADFLGMPPVPPKGLKSLLENVNWNYKVVNPIGGISGFFERVFSANVYVGKTYSHVLFNPGAATEVTADRLQAEIFGGYAGGAAQLSVFTTQEIIEDQGSLDTYYSIQGTEEGVGGAMGDLLGILQKLLKALPIVLWGALAVGVLWVGWKGYKYIRDERAGNYRTGGG